MDNSLLELLDEAIAAKDLEAIASISKKLKAKPKPVKKAKIKVVEEEQVDEDFEDDESPVRAASIPDDDGNLDDRRYCRRVPFNTKKRKNTFKDDVNITDDAESDKKVIKMLGTLTRKKKRAPARKIKAKCKECNNTYMVDPSTTLVGVIIEGESVPYTCSGCLNKKGGGR